MSNIESLFPHLLFSILIVYFNRLEAIFELSVTLLYLDKRCDSTREHYTKFWIFVLKNNMKILLLKEILLCSTEEEFQRNKL